MAGVNTAWEKPRIVPWLTLHGQLSISPEQLRKQEFRNSEILPQIDPRLKDTASRKDGCPNYYAQSQQMSFRSPPLTGLRHIPPLDQVPR